MLDNYVPTVWWCYRMVMWWCHRVVTWWYHRLVTWWCHRVVIPPCGDVVIPPCVDVVIPPCGDVVMPPSFVSDSKGRRRRKVGFGFVFCCILLFYCYYWPHLYSAILYSRADSLQSISHSFRQGRSSRTTFSILILIIIIICCFVVVAAVGVEVVQYSPFTVKVPALDWQMWLSVRLV